MNLHLNKVSCLNFNASLVSSMFSFVEQFDADLNAVPKRFYFDIFRAHSIPQSIKRPVYSAYQCYM